MEANGKVVVVSWKRTLIPYYFVIIIPFLCKNLLKNESQDIEISMTNIWYCQTGSSTLRKIWNIQKSKTWTIVLLLRYLSLFLLFITKCFCRLSLIKICEFALLEYKDGFTLNEHQIDNFDDINWFDSLKIMNENY